MTYINEINNAEYGLEKDNEKLVNAQEKYNEFIENAKKASLYNIDTTAKYGDQLITLSTCSYHVKDGRFAVVGKKIE